MVANGAMDAAASFVGLKAIQTALTSLGRTKKPIWETS
jgi:hypothetical protein